MDKLGSLKNKLHPRLNRFGRLRMFRFALPLAMLVALFATSAVSADDCGCEPVTKCCAVKKLTFERVTCCKPVTRLRLKCVTDECGCPRLRLCKETHYRQVCRIVPKITTCCKCKTVCCPKPKCCEPKPCCCN